MNPDNNISPHVRLVEARAKNEALRRAKKLREAYGINFYRPHIKQHRFHCSEATGRYARFANRTGKTVCGSAEDVAWLLGERAWYRSTFDLLDGLSETVETHIGRNDHPLLTQGIPNYPIKGLLVASDWDKAKEIFTNQEGSYENLGELFQLLPHEAISKVHKNRGGNVDMISVKALTEHGGYENLLYIDTVESFKHAWRSAESSDFDFIHYDEPPPQKMFIANKRGLTDRNGKFWINATPVAELWVNDEFCPPKTTNRLVDKNGLRFNKTETGGDRFIITATIYDNPYISEKGRDEFVASLTAEERQCRAEGLPLNLAGLIYKQFKYDTHVLEKVPVGWEDYHLPPKDACIRVMWDVHDAIPQAIMLIATLPTGESFVYDEMYFSKIIDENAELLREKLENRFCCQYLIDPRAIIKSPVTNESILDVLCEEGLYFEPGSKDMALGISRTREKLDERGRNGNPTIYFSPNVDQTLWEIMRYSYNPRTMKPVDKDDHMCENLRRGVLTGLEYVEPPNDSDWLPERQTEISMAEDLVV